MSFLFKMPSMPPLPKIEEPKVEDVPSAEDEARRLQAEEDEKRRTLNRTGRRSTILTGTGLTEIADENIDKKTLLGS